MLFETCNLCMCTPCQCTMGVKYVNSNYPPTPDTHTLPKRFKKLVWFKEGDPIPAEAVYTRESKTEFHMISGIRMPTGHTLHLYEVPS